MLHSLLLVTFLAQATAPPSPPALELSPSPSASPAPTTTPAPTPTPSGPQLTVSTNVVNLNPVQQGTISVSGASPPLSATLERKLVSVTVDPTGTSLTLTATQATGSDVLHLLDANGARADITVRVAFNAGTIVPQATLRITGAPADPNWLATQVDRLISRLTLALPGAQTQIGRAVVPIAPLAPGTITQFSIPVSITSPDGTYFDQTGTTVVNVQNVSLDPFSPGLLFYDDDPEHLNADGVLYRGTVSPGQPARLYYYHDDGNDPRRLVVALTSSSQDPTSIQAIDVTVGPNEDVMTAGNALTRDFLLTKTHDQGLILDLAGDQPYFLDDVAMTSRQLVAGTIDLRVLSGGPVIVTVMAVSPNTDPATIVNQPQLPGDGHHRTGAFNIAEYGDQRIDYVAGSSDADVIIGQTTPPSAAPGQNGHDWGGYGVLQQIDVTMNNPGDAPVQAYLYFEPLGGVSRGSFLVDGNLVRIGCVREPEPYLLTSFELPPHQTQRSFVQTMTDGGSFYPAQIGVTAVAPRPSAPPINAPDGCFPSTGPSGSPSPAPSPSP